MKRTLNTIVAEILTKRKPKQFTAHEIAEIIVKTEHEFCEKKIKRTGKTDKMLVFQLMSEIGAQYPKMKVDYIAKTDTRPTKYFYKKPAAKAKAKVAAKK